MFGQGVLFSFRRLFRVVVLAVRSALRASGRRDTPTLLVGVCRVRSRSSSGLTLHIDCAGHCDQEIAEWLRCGVAFTVREALAGLHLGRATARLRSGLHSRSYWPLRSSPAGARQLAAHCVPPCGPCGSGARSVLFPRNTSTPPARPSRPPSGSRWREESEGRSTQGWPLGAPRHRRAVASRPGPAAKHPASSPKTSRGCWVGWPPQDRPHLAPGGCATTGQGPA